MDKDKKNDINYAIAKAGLGSIPIVGAAASELLQLIVTPPLEKRRLEWMEEISQKLKILEEKKSLDLNDLKENEIFIDVVLQCTQEVLKTSEAEKLENLRNSVLNTALDENPDISEIQIFVKLVSDFTVWHIKILKLFDNPEEYFGKHNLSIENYVAASLHRVLLEAFPELGSRKEFYELIWDDLKRAGLHNTSGLHTTMSGSSLLQSRTTDFGKKFLRYISSNPTE